MGPRSGDRGNSQTICPFAAPWVASMGPRSGDRGNEDARVQVLRDETLQWGRDLVIAEIWNALPIPATAVGFNGAAIW